MKAAAVGSKNNSLNYKKIVKSVNDFVKKHPLLVALVLIVIYFVVFQRGVLTTGDSWAEGFSEYLAKSVEKSFWATQAPSWEGYLTFIPSILAKLYVHFLPSLVGHIDYYYRYVVLAFSIASTAFIAAPINRKLIKNDYVRLGFVLGTLFLLSHVSILSFINVWYILFVPIIIMSLNRVKLTVKQQIGYTLFSLAAAFTKPSLILVPFVIYRIIKTKEYVSNGLILAAAFTQTYLTLFYTTDGRGVFIGIKQLFLSVYLGAGVSFLKILQIYPSNQLYIILADLIILGLFVLLFKKRGWFFGLAVLAGYLFSIYTNLLAPGTQTVFTASDIYNNIYKLQRELMTNFFDVFLVFINLDYIYKYVNSLRQARYYAPSALSIVLILWFGLLYHHIDTTSSVVYVDINPFRHSLNTGHITCVPISPSPEWSPGSNWYLQFHGGCTYANFDKTPDYKHLDTSLSKPLNLDLTILKNRSLKSVLVLTKNTTGKDAVLKLKDESSGQVYTSTIKKSPDSLRFVAFDVSNLPSAVDYKFELSSPNPGIYTGYFIRTQTPDVYTYDIGN